MGMTDWQLLATSRIAARLRRDPGGVRVATVVSVGTATIAAAIGAGGLGVYIFRGVAVVDDTLILAGRCGGADGARGGRAAGSRGAAFAWRAK